MNTAQYNRVLIAQYDYEVREQLIREYDGFIRQCASKACGYYVDQHEDAYSEALIAFNEAISSYEEGRGSFTTFASTLIHNKVTDYLRKEKRHYNVIPFSSLVQDDEQGNEKELEIADPKSGTSDAAIEIEALKEELAKYDISFFDLPASSPKAAKTKAACVEVVRYIVTHPLIQEVVRAYGTLPAKQILQEVKVPKKVLERHRKYIIAGFLICDGEYTVMQDYFNCKEVHRV